MFSKPTLHSVLLQYIHIHNSKMPASCFSKEVTRRFKLFMPNPMTKADKNKRKKNSEK